MGCTDRDTDVRSRKRTQEDRALCTNRVCLLWSPECQENKKRTYVRAQGLETYSVEKSTGLGMCLPISRSQAPECYAVESQSS